MSIANDGSVGIGTQTPTDALLDVEGPNRINKNDLFLATGTDRNHGLGYRWYIGGSKIDGPFLYGYSGGALGVSAGWGLPMVIERFFTALVKLIAI